LRGPKGQKRKEEEAECWLICGWQISLSHSIISLSLSHFLSCVCVHVDIYRYVVRKAGRESKKKKKERKKRKKESLRYIIVQRASIAQIERKRKKEERRKERKTYLCSN
jgi:hypothetical protein